MTAPHQKGYLVERWKSWTFRVERASMSEGGWHLSIVEHDELGPRVLSTTRYGSFDVLSQEVSTFLDGSLWSFAEVATGA